MGKSAKRGFRSKGRTLSSWGRGLWRRAEQAVAEAAAAEASGEPEPEETAGGSASSSTGPAGGSAARVAGRSAPGVAGGPAPEQEAGRPAPAAWCAPEYWVHSEDAEQTLQEVYRTLSWRLHEGYADYAAGAAAHCLAKRREGGLEPDLGTVGPKHQADPGELLVRPSERWLHRKSASPYLSSSSRW